MAPEKKLYVTPFRRPLLPSTSSSQTPIIGLPPTVPDQRSLIARQRANITLGSSSRRPPRASTAPPPFSVTESEDADDIQSTTDSNVPSTVATSGSAPLTRRPRPRLAGDRPGPGPPEARALPNYTEVATLHTGLGERILENDFDALRELVPRFGEDIEDVKYIGSYKWISPDSTGRPTLAVPGMPDVWQPVECVGSLRRDEDIPDYNEFPDYAAALLPTNLSTLEPAFRALTSPSVLTGVNIVSGRNSLRKLWSAVNNDYNDHWVPFRIDLLMVDGMVLLERYEPPNRLQARESLGYHLGYHEKQTRKIMEGSDRTPGCIRVIKYSFGGLSMVVKFDAPAYNPDQDEAPNEDRSRRDQDSSVSVNGSSSADIDTDFDADTETDADTGTETSPQNHAHRSTASEINHDSIDGLSTLAEDMEGLDFDDPVHNGQSIAISYYPHHRPPSQSSLVTIKTKRHHHECDLSYYFPQHFFAQVPTLHYARHRAGNFTYLGKDDREEYGMLDPSLKEVHQAGIDKMAALLRWIVRLVEEHCRDDHGGHNGLGLVWDGKKFSVAVREGGPQLSAPVVEMIKDARHS